MSERKLAERNIPGMMNRASRFAEVEHAQNAGATLCNRSIIPRYKKS